MHPAITGALAGAAAEFLTLPIYSLKNVMETSRQPLRVSLSNMIRQGGVLSFYNGWYWGISRQTVNIAARYGFYKKTEQEVSKHLGHSLPLWVVRLASGAASGLPTALLTHPLDNFCITAQLRAENRNRLTIFERWAFEGWLFPFKGLSAAFFRNFMVGALVFPLNETYRGAEVGWGEQKMIIPPYLSPVLASLSATMIIQPVDFVKTRKSQNLPAFVGWNPRSYYRGLSMNLLRVVPHFWLVSSVIGLLESK